QPWPQRADLPHRGRAYRRLRRCLPTRHPTSFVAIEGIATKEVLHMRLIRPRRPFKLTVVLGAVALVIVAAALPSTADASEHSWWRWRHHHHQPPAPPSPSPSPSPSSGPTDPVPMPR